MKPNWTKVLSILALAASGASMILDAVSQKHEIKDAAKDAAKEAVKEYFEGK